MASESYQTDILNHGYNDGKTDPELGGAPTLYPAHRVLYDESECTFEIEMYPLTVGDDR